MLGVMVFISRDAVVPAGFWISRGHHQHRHGHPVSRRLELADLRRAAGGAGVVLPILIVTAPYRLLRVTTFMNPWADEWARVISSHALIAFGRGEWFGVGLGASVEKLLYLPMAHRLCTGSDREELGFIGVAAVIACSAS